jgi:shikimate kinase
VAEMKKNIAIVGLDRTMSRLVAQTVSEQLGMRFFDMRELFVFDHKPNTFKEILVKYGITYYRQKESQIIRYASDFENVLLNVDNDILYKKGTLESLAKNYLICYIHIPTGKIQKIAQSEEYSCYKEKSMYNLSREQIETRIANIRAQMDLEVNVSSSSYLKAGEKIIKAIQKYYNV